MIELTDTNSAEIAAEFVRARIRAGSPAMGMVMTLIIVLDEDAAPEAMEAARLASRELSGGDPFIYVPINGPGASDASASLQPDVPREQAKQQALEAVRKLRLQSILSGSARRACMIDNKLYFEGQTVDQFEVEKIARDGVTVRRGEFSFRLTMSR